VRAIRSSTDSSAPSQKQNQNHQTISHMKINRFQNLLRALSAAAAIVLFASAAQAGPGPHQMYYPVKTQKQAQNLQVGQRIAISCGNCGGVTTITVDKDRSYLRGFACPLCKREFRIVQPGGGGRADAIGRFVYVDEASHIARLSAMHVE
jgi:hypothetical protein